MDNKRTFNTIVLGMRVLLVGLSIQTSARSESHHNDPPHGDWEVKIAVNGKQRTAILSLFGDAKGNQSGQWIGLEQLSELKEVNYQGDKLSFTAKAPNRDGQSTSWKFNGTINEDGLSGTVSSRDRGEQTVEGKRIPSMPDIVGNYGFSYSKNVATFALAIRANKEGKLTAQWLTGNDKVPVTDLVYKDNVLSFKSKLGSYEGGLTQAKALNGTYTTAEGREFSVLSQRLGTPMIGAWNLEVISEQGSWHQSLRVNRDMSGWYGAIPIKEVRLQGDDPNRPNRPRTVTFETVVVSGEHTAATSFAGNVTEAKLSGKLTTSNGTANVLGKKVVQTRRRRTAP